MPAKSIKGKPAKPRPDFPLTANGNGQWSKKIKGKVFFFGVWSDPEAALAKWLESKDTIHATGRKAREKGGATVESACNRFLHVKQQAVDAGELQSRTWYEYRRCCLSLAEAFGRTRAVADLAAEDFETLRAKLAKRLGATALGNEIQRVRTVFKFAYDVELIDRPVKFGPTFKKPSKKVRRAVRKAGGKKLFAAADLRKIIAKAGVPLKAMILLGINCGMGQHDIATLPVDRIDLQGGFHNYERPKTGVDRRCPLWPETITALKAAIAKRPAAKDPADAGLAFVTKYGARWVRLKERMERQAAWIDSIGLEFTKIVRELGIEQHGIKFYSLRRTFRTVADEAKDEPATMHIMGHADDDNDMSATYRQGIGDERLKAVTDHVHAWLYPVKKAVTSKKSKKR